MSSGSRSQAPDFLTALGIHRPPNFEDLDPHNDTDRECFIGRSNHDIQKVAQDINNIAGLSPKKVLLLTASPGVGKSTFCRFLCQEVGESAYISLFDYSPALEYNFSLNLSNHQVLEFGARIENALVRLFEGRIGTASALSKFGSEFDFEVDAFIIEHISSIIRSIDKFHQRVYIFIDNLDFLGAPEQLRILRIVGSLSSIGGPVSFIVSGRPFVTTMSRVEPREFLGSTTHLLVHLPYLSIDKVVNARLDAVRVGDRSHLEFLDEAAYEFLDRFIDGNVALGLKILVDAFLRWVDIDTNTKAPISEVKIKEIMMGERLPKFDLRADGDGNIGFIMDILSKINKKDRVPVIYELLKELNTPSVIDDDFVDQFNRRVRKIDSQGPIYDKFQIRGWVKRMRGMRLVRRVGIREFPRLISRLRDGTYREDDFAAEYKLTRTGLETLLLSRDERYQDMIDFFRLPTGYQNCVKQDNAAFEEISESAPWLTK